MVLKIMIKILAGVSTALLLTVVFSIYQHYEIVKCNGVVEDASRREQACNRIIGVENEVNGLTPATVSSEFNRLFPSSDGSEWQLHTDSDNSESGAIYRRETQSNKRLEAEKRMSEKLIICEDRYYAFERCVLGSKY